MYLNYRIRLGEKNREYHMALFLHAIGPDAVIVKFDKGDQQKSESFDSYVTTLL